MQEFFLILIVAFLLFRILRPAFFISINRFPSDRQRTEEYEKNTFRRREGETTIEKTHPASHPSNNKNSGGDYVDYEEVK